MNIKSKKQKNNGKRINIQNFLYEIKEALLGGEKDYTSMRLRKAMLLLAIPMVLEMIMESVFAIVDIFFVSKLGSDAVATVGLTESIITIVYALGFGLSMATTAMVSRRIGEKRPDKASETAFQAIVAGLLISLPVTIAGIFFSEELLRLMGASDFIIEHYALFPQIMLGGNFVIVLLFIINAVFRSAGDAAIAMRVLWMANIINLILDPLLIFGIGFFPQMGVAGAALATTIGRSIAVIYQLWILFRGNSQIKLYWKSLKIEINVLLQLFKLSFGGIFQNIIATSSWIGLMRIVSTFGSQALAGYTIAIRLVIFFLLPSWGLANAASTLVGQNLGAKKPDRAEKAVNLAAIANMVLLGLISIFMVFFAKESIGFFTKDSNIMRFGIPALQIISSGFLIYGLGQVMIQSFNGAGDTVTPTWIYFFAFWLVEVPLAYLLSIQFEVGSSGVFYAIIIAESCMSILAWILFKQGKWKLKEV